MPLIHCPSCNKEISSEAKACPDCGHPIAKRSYGSSVLRRLVILILIIIIGGFLFVCVGGPVFFGVVGHNVVSQLDKSRVENTKIQITQLESGLKLFKVDNGFYPDTQQGLDALVVLPTTGREPRRWDPDGYMEGDQVPFDQWSNEFIYIGPDVSGGNTYEIISPGPDGIPQTEDDISSRNIE